MKLRGWRKLWDGSFEGLHRPGMPAPLAQPTQGLPLALAELRVPPVYRRVGVLLYAVPHLRKGTPKGLKLGLPKPRPPFVRRRDLLEVALRELLSVAPHAPQAEVSVGVLHHAAPGDKGSADICANKAGRKEKGRRKLR